MLTDRTARWVKDQKPRTRRPQADHPKDGKRPGPPYSNSASEMDRSCPRIRKRRSYHQNDIVKRYQSSTVHINLFSGVTIGDDEFEFYSSEDSEFHPRTSHMLRKQLVFFANVV